MGNVGEIVEDGSDETDEERHAPYPAATVSTVEITTTVGGSGEESGREGHVQHPAAYRNPEARGERRVTAVPDRGAATNGR